VTAEDRAALEESEAVVGYGLYLDQAKPFLKGQEILASGMTKESQRADLALDLALSGRRAAVVSGGDSGVYAMAGAVFERAAARKLPLGFDEGRLEIKVRPGVPSMIAGAALLGAPLTHDFCAISLSDRLTPWPTIEKRLDLASQAGFVLAIHNPKSHGRDWQLKRAAEILAQNLAPQTPVGVVARVGREGERKIVTDLAGLPFIEADMQTLVVVGNATTFVYQGYLVTPRGYEAKYGE
jgi:precorrin-3B C17-methyltransferase